MRYLFLIIIVSWLTPTFGKSKVEVRILECSNNSSIGFNTEVFILKENNLIHQLDLSSNKTEVIKLDSGDYQFAVKTFYNEIIDTLITINQKNQTVLLCVDDLINSKSKTLPLIDQLKNEESYTIRVNQTGCFHFTEDSLIVSRSAERFYIKYDQKEILLNKEQIALLRKFEKHLLNLLDPAHCTSVDHYKLIYNNKIYSKNDGSCSWSGFDNLLINLGLKKDK